MKTIHCLNAISKYGLGFLTEDYKLTEDIQEAEGILVRSASLHETEFSDALLAIARAGAGVNNIPLEDCAKKGIVVFNTPGANANGVKELVLAGMLLASRDIIGGIAWCQDNKEDANISKTVEKSKKAFAGGEIKGMRRHLWAWRFMALILIFPLMRHGCFPGMSSILPVWIRFMRNAILSPSMCRFWMGPEE